jgi:hypothetical protein
MSVLSQYLQHVDKKGNHTHRTEEVIDVMYAVLRLILCFRRRFFVTSAGRLGLGPRSMRPDDGIAILKGGNTPFVLRKVEGGYLMIGSAYVHGIIDGEAVQLHLSGDGTCVEFQLR